MELSDFVIRIFEEPVVLTSVAIVSLFLTYYPAMCYLKRFRSKLPSGPSGVPLLGNLLQMVKNPHLKLSKWAIKYGSMCTIKLAHRKAIVVSDIKLLKELFGTMASTGKFKTDTILLMSQGPNGILNSEGSTWTEQRQFCMKSLRRLGYGQTSSMEPLILHEANELCDWMRKSMLTSSSGTVDLEHVLGQSTINALWTFVTGERLKLEDTTVATMFSNMANAAQYTMKTGLGFFPWLKYISPILSGYTDLDNASKTIHEFVGRKFQERRQKHVQGHPENLIDGYIDHLGKVNEANGPNSFLGKQGWRNSISSVVELFIAGGETTSSSLKWLAVYVSHCRDVQRKLQEEIYSVLGRERDPSLLDRTSMPYTEAVILETLRFSSILPLGVPHELLEEINFHGYILPKGLILMPNLYHIHHSREIWGDPEEFRPERFLTDTDNGTRLREFLVPFQPGRRRCLGAPLANDVMFLFAAKLFQQFTIDPVPHISKELYYKADIGIALLPKCAKFVLTVDNAVKCF